MLRKVFTLMAILSIFSSCEIWAATINSNWIGGGGGPWGNPGNWNPQLIPDNTAEDSFVVTIDSAEGMVHIGLLQDFTIDRLDCFGAVEVEKRTLGWKEFVSTIKLTIYDPKGLMNYGSLELEGDDGMSVIGNVTNTDGSELGIWGILEIENGNLYNCQDAHIEISGDDIAVENGGLDNRGSIKIDPETEFTSEHTLHNEGFGYIHAEQQLQNKGQIIASNGTLSIITESSITNTGTLKNNAGTALHIQTTSTNIDNTGTISINAGGAVTFNCGLNNELNGTLELAGGTFAATELTQHAGATFKGFGGITSDVVIDSDGIIELTGPTNIFGDVTIEENAKLQISDGQVIITGHTVCNGTIILKGSRIVPQGGLSGDCDIISEPSDYNNMQHLAFLADTWLWQITVD
jgi:hypothetical protein